MRQAQCEERVRQWFASNGYTMLPKEVLGWEVIAQKDDDMWLVEMRGEEFNSLSNEGDFERMVGQIPARIDQFDDKTHRTVAVPLEDYKPVLRKFAQSLFWTQMAVGLILVSEGSPTISYLKPDEVGAWLARF